MTELSTIASIAAAAGILIGATLAVLQLRNLVIQRKVNTLISLVPSFRSDGGEQIHKAARLLFASGYKDYHDFVERYGDPETSNNEVVSAFVQISGWYEGLGFLYYRKLVDRRLFCELFSYMPIRDWEKLQPIINGLREQDSNQKEYEFFEFMVEDMRTRLKDPKVL